MKKFFILIITFILLFSNSSINVNAVAGFSGNGSASGYSGSYSGSSSGECEGWRLNLSPIILFSLMDVSDENALMKINSYYMINTKGTYDDAFLSKSGYINGHESGKVVTLDGDIKPKQLPYIFNLQGDNNDGIIPNSSNVFLNFNVEKLRSAIIDVNSEDGITEIYRNIVIYMLEQEYGYEVANGYLTLEQINQNLYAKNGKGLGSYRVFIEPVYALQYQCSTKYSFMTTKAIASSIKSGENYKVYISSLYNNLYSDEVVSSLNKGGYISPVTENEYKNALANPNHGAGYAVVRLSYEISDNKSCVIEKNSESGKFIYYDSNGDTWEDDIRGDNLNYFLNSGGCNCDDINNSEYKTEIINTEIKENILKNNCSSGTCVYDEESKIFYGSNSEKLNTYEGFIESCECTNSNVVALKKIGGFSSIYSTKCPTIVPIVRVSSNLKKCTVKEATENYEIEYEETKSINNYCSLNCKETINFNDVYGKYSVRAGEYFELGKYPTLKANKSCNVNVDYNKWKSDYDNLVIKQTKYLTDWNKYKSSMMPTQSTQTCSCDEFGNCIYATLYTASYYGYSYNGVNITKSSVPITFSWGGCFNSPLDVDSSAEFKFNEVSGKIENLFSNLKTCSNYLNRLDGKNVRENSTSKEDYYTFKSDLKYYYYQDNPKYGTINNTEKANNVDDSAMEKVSVGESRENGNFKNYIHDIKSYPYIDSSGNLLSKNVGANYYNELINRTVEFNYEYKPSIIKYVDSYTSEINSNFGSLSNPVLIGNVYDTDAISIAKNDNDNYFSFTSLGDDNQIFEWFKAGKKVLFLDGVRNARKDDLNRYCDYEITNDLFETSCNGTSICDSKLKVIYRSVDPLDIDPNDRLLNDKGFSNWKNVKGKTVKAKIEDDAKKDLTYSPDNLEYSFILDSQAIQAIRSDNITKNYDDFQGYYTCIEGNKCESEFISNANAVDGKKGDIGLKFGSSLNGRTSWKEFKEELGKFYIDNEEINVIN